MTLEEVIAQIQAQNVEKVKAAMQEFFAQRVAAEAAMLERDLGQKTQH